MGVGGGEGREDKAALREGADGGRICEMETVI